MVKEESALLGGDKERMSFSEKIKRYVCVDIYQETLTLAVLCALLTSPAFTDANYLHG